MRQRKAEIICDLQFGSTGKGLFAGYRAELRAPDVVVHAFGVNSGHTYVDRGGRRFVHCMLPNGVVSPNLEKVLVGPGAQVNLDLLLKEAVECADLLRAVGAVVLVHPNAAMIQDRHVQEEAGPMTRIGSTKKGCGAALVEKVRRNPESKIVAEHFKNAVGVLAEEYGVPVRVCTQVEYEQALEKAHRVQVEGAQGYSLGINSGFYPYCTSRECTPAQVASDTLLPLSFVGSVVGCARTYPIRVANRYDEDGNLVGWSGPGYPGQRETSFEALGQNTEYTTVTKLPRRVFEFSTEQTYRALRTVRPDQVFLNFAQYDTPEDLQAKLHVFDGVAGALDCGSVTHLGVGPTFDDVCEREELGYA